MIKNFKNVELVNSPLVEHNLSIIRNKNTDSVLFRSSIKNLSIILCIEATKNLPLKDVEIETPIQKTTVKIIDKENTNIFIVPILRAGLGIAEHMYEILPFSTIQHLGMYRNEKTLQPVWYYNKLPNSFKNTENTFVYICDPMLATGGSIIEAIKLYIQKGIPEQNITVLNIISSSEGIKKVINNFPQIKIYTTSIDEKLNENGYIIPGLGDAGDRIFNTIY